MCAGRVLNRFSKDLGFLDDIIPQPFFDYLAVRPVVTYMAASNAACSTSPGAW